MNKRIVAAVLSGTVLLSVTPTIYADNTNYANGAVTKVNFYDTDGLSINSAVSGLVNLTDNNIYSEFASPIGVNSAQYIIDIYKTRYVNRIFIKEMDSTILEYKIYISQDGYSWTQKYYGKKIGAYGRTINFPAEKARYIKLEVLKTANKYNDATISINELQVYNSSDIVKSDLENAIYLAEKKLELISERVAKRHYTDDDRKHLAALIEKGKTALLSSNQSTIDNARDSLDNTVAALSEVLPDQQDFDAITEKYMNTLVGNDKEYNSVRKTSISKNEADVEKYWGSMIKSPQIELWSEYIPPRSNTQQEQGKINESLTRLKIMAIAYKQEHNKYYSNKELLDDILMGIDFILTKKYDPSIAQYGNWYGWVVSTPAVLSELMVILRDELSEETTKNIIRCVEYRVPQDFHYTWSGANRMYLAAAALRMGVVMGSEEYIHRVHYSLSQESKYLDKQKPGISGVNNGLYWDGSYIFHEGYMYNATYGRDQLTNTSNIADYLSGSLWEIDHAILDDLATRITDGYEAIIYNGRTVDNTAGRGVGSGLSYGNTIASNIYNVSKFLSEPYKTRFESIAKQIKLDGDVSDAVTKDDSIIARGDIFKLKRYPIGDKLVLNTPKFGLGLSMFSNRTKTFEAPNGDAMQAWYASSGVTYILTKDKDQYNKDYWITVDHYRLPGITVDKIPRTLTRFEGEMFSDKSWTSSMDFEEKYGVAGMMICNYKSTLNGKKSYFMFDDEIVCIGSNIKGGSQNIETIVDNRKIDDEYSAKLTVDGVELTDGEKNYKGVKTAHIESTEGGNGVGYYFFEGADINALKEHRSEREADMWLSDSTNIVDKNFATIWYDHGAQPKNANYSYAILPEFTDEQTTKYKENPGIEIISQTDDVHAVKDINLGITGFNFWNKAIAKAENVTSDGQLCMVKKEDDKQLILSMTDPTMTATKKVTITLEGDYKTVLSKDSSITVTSLSPLVIEYDPKNANGQKSEITISKSAVSYTPSSLSDALVMKSGETKALYNNRIDSCSPLIIKDGNAFIPAKWFSDKKNTMFSYSQAIDTYQLIDNIVLKVTPSGSITINGEEQNDLNSSDVLINNDELYLSAKVFSLFYNTDYTLINDTLFFGAKKPTDDTAKSVKQYLSWE